MVAGRASWTNTPCARLSIRLRDLTLDDLRAIVPPPIGVFVRAYCARTNTLSIDRRDVKQHALRRLARKARDREGCWTLRGSELRTRTDRVGEPDPRGEPRWSGGLGEISACQAAMLPRCQTTLDSIHCWRRWVAGLDSDLFRDGPRLTLGS
jgi:hypothetical protein